MAQRQPIDNALRQKTAELAPATRTRFAHRPWLLALVLVVATLVAYRPMWRASFIWDDDTYVTENQSLQSLDGLGKIWLKLGTTLQYYPLTFTSFWAEYHLW